MNQNQLNHDAWLRRAAPVTGLLILILIGAGVFFLANSFTSGDLLDSSPLNLSTRSDGRPVQALYRINYLASRDGWTSSLHRQAGDLHFALGDMRAAVAHWSSAKLTEPVHLQRLARVLIELEEWQDLQMVVEQILSADPNNNWAKLQLGLLLAPFDPVNATVYLREMSQVEGYRDVAGALLHITLNDVENPLISMKVGQVVADYGMWNYAERAFQHAALVGDPFPEALAYAGIAREQQGKDGAQWIDAAVALGGASPQARFAKGLQLRTQGEFDASLQEFADAVALDPSNPAYYAELAEAHRLLLNYEQAAHWFRTAVAVSDNDLRFERLLATFYAQEGFRLTETNAAALQQVSGVVPNDPDLLAGFGYALHLMGDTDAGLIEIEGALALAPENAQALYNKARIMVDLGDYETAIGLLERILRSESPYVDSAQDLLDALENLDDTGPELTPPVQPGP